MSVLLITECYCVQTVRLYLEDLSIPLGTGNLVGRDVQGRRIVWQVMASIGRHIHHDWAHSTKQLVVHLPVKTVIKSTITLTTLLCIASQAGQHSL